MNCKTVKMNVAREASVAHSNYFRFFVLSLFVFYAILTLSVSGSIVLHNCVHI